MSKMKFLYLLWFILNSAIFYLTGYPQKFVEYLKKLPFVDEPWSRFIEHSDKLYLISSRDIMTYDITEYSLALLVPVFISYLYNATRPKQMKYQKPREAL
jgi:hypothetical protein